MKTSLWEIFWLFVKIGAILLGGGYVILPILTEEVVKKRNWITADELVEYYSISQCLPGIIAVNTAIFTGYRLKGKFGAIAATVGMCFAPFVAIVCLASVLGMLVQLTLVKNVFWGVGIGILVMIMLTLKELWNKSVVDKFTLFMFLSILAVSVWFKTSPVLVVISSAFCGILYKITVKKLEKKGAKE